MNRKSGGLTDAKVVGAGPGLYVDGDGLRLLVRSTGARYWMYRYTLAGKVREMGLGRAGDDEGAVSLTEARAKAAEHRQLVKAGIDPLVAREAQAAAAAVAAQRAAIRRRTFRTVAEAYWAANSDGWRHPEHLAEWEAILEDHAYPDIGDLPVSKVTTEHVLAVLKPIWKKQPETASLLRSRIETVLDYATVQDWRSGVNPASWRGHLSNLLPAHGKLGPQDHHTALPWREVGAFLVALRKQPGIGARALAFAILTAAHSGEVLGATWGEIDMAGKLWTVPAARLRGGYDHRIPLSAAAVTQLADLTQLRTGDGPDALLFPGAQPETGLSAMELLLRRMKPGQMTVHGFRRTFRAWAAASTTTAPEVMEAAMGHAQGSRTEAADAQGALFHKRRLLMDAWGRYCTGAASAGEDVPALAAKSAAA